MYAVCLFLGLLLKQSKWNALRAVCPHSAFFNAEAVLNLECMLLFKKKSKRGWWRCGEQFLLEITEVIHHNSVRAVGKTMEYILPFLTTSLIIPSSLNLFSEMQHLRFFLHILSKDCRVSEIHFAAFHKQQ